MSNQYPGGVISKTPVVPTSLSAPGIWTLSQQAAAQNTNTWPFPRDPQFNYVTMLLHGDGSAQALPTTGVGAGASSTVTAFNTDASTNNFNVTINGDARSDNFSPYLGTGYYSNYFDGTSGQYLNAPANTVFNFGTGDFTVEAWVYPTSTSGTRPIIEIRTSGGANGFAFLSQSGATTLNVYTNGGFVGASTNSLTLNTWNHVALTRSTNTWTYWINGVSGGSFTNSSTQSDGGTTGPKIGGSTTAGEIWIGYISNARITKGAALYTTTFTPSTTPLTTTVSSGTVSLLTSQSNRFIDNSTNTFTITVNGAPKVSPAQPFTLPSSVATYGSGYFGSANYLSAASNAAFGMGTGDFTVEAWVYPNAAYTTYNYIWATGANGGLVVYVLGGVLYVRSYNVADLLASSVAPALNAWSHVAVTRSGTTLRIFVNGVQTGTTTNSTNFATGSGLVGNDGSNAAPWYGYITDVRVVKGTAIYTTTFTPPTAPLTAITNTSLLTTQYNGGGNNSGFKDSGPFDYVVSRFGNTTQGTFAPYAANWSNYFNGSSYIYAAANAAFNIGSNDASVEMWCYSQSTAADVSLNGQNSASNSTIRLLQYGGYYAFTVNNDTVRSTGVSVILNSWVHLVVTITGGTARMFVNGVLRNVTTGLGSVSSVGGSYVIGSEEGIANYFTGYMSDFRFVNGSIPTAYQTSGTTTGTTVFTPPTTPLTAITNTVLLTCQSNRFIDNSSNAFSIITGGSPSVQRFSPYAPLTVYNPAVNGGSAYLDGNSDYLSVANNGLLGSGDWTLELWMNAPVGQTDKPIIEARNPASGSGTTTGFTLTMITSTEIRLFCGSERIRATVNYVNTWSHIALVKSGSTTTMYFNGVSVGTTTALGDMSDTGFIVGAGYYGGTSLNAYGNFYISNMRVAKGLAVYTGNFTPPTAPVTAITNTVLLMNYTNAGILDNAMMNDLETVGNAQISTSVKKYGTGSMYFDGTGDWLTTPYGPTQNFGTGSFTIEGWFYLNSLAASYYVPAGTWGSGTSDEWLIQIRNDGYIRFLTTSGSTFYSAGITTSTWYHIAIVRNGSTVTIYVNGTSVGSYTCTNSLGSTAKTLYIGTQAGTWDWNGYIDDFRITNGYARYTSNFTAPTAAFPNG